MNRSCVMVAVILMILGVGPAAVAGELVDHGNQGEFFLEADTGHFWFDPAVFLGLDRETVDTFVSQSRLWSWATSAQVDALVGSTAPAGLALEDAMGLRQSTATGPGPRWLGFHSGSEFPNGWLIQADVDPFTALTQSGPQWDASLTVHGAWVIAAEDPLLAPRLENVGEAGQFFYDQYSALYWQDPVNFVGMAREEIGVWLAANPSWRWATREEIEGLVGMMSAGDVPLAEILGEPQIIVTGPAPRWVGYYDQVSESDGMLLQADLLPPYIFANSAGSQAGVAGWNPGLGSSPAT